MKKLFFFFVILLLTNQVVSQDLWTIYTNGENITSIAGEEGNIWVGTTAGLVNITEIDNDIYFYFNNTSELGLVV